MIKTSNNILEIQHISVHYGGVKALNNVSLSIEAGEIVALMGPNGAGKSTVLKALFGITPIDSGTVQWHDAVVKPTPHEMVMRGITFVPQGRRVFTHLTVDENLDVGGQFIKDRKELVRRKEEIYTLFPILLEKKRDSSGTLSGGQQQMLAIGRGLMTNPQLLLLDEPTLGLTPKLVKEVFALVKLINERHKTAIIVVEHNLKSLLDIAHRAMVLDRGSVAAEGNPRDIISSDLFEKIFLGAV